MYLNNIYERNIKCISQGEGGHWKTRKLTKRQMLLLFIARFLIAYTDAVKAARDIIIMS